MNRCKFPINTLTIILVAASAAACGTSSDKTDVSVVEDASDAVENTDTVTVQDFGVADTARPDEGLKDADTNDPVDSATTDIEPEDIGTDDGPEFHWASGCTGVPTGAQWTMIEDSTFPRGPLIQMSDRDTVTILWRTAEPTTDEGCVDYAVGEQNLTKCGMADQYGQYEVRLDGLPAATEIRYSVRTGELETKELTFRTMPDTPVPMKFAVFADAHCHVENLQKMSAAALAEGVDFAFGVGDFVNSVLVDEYDETFMGFQNLGSRVNIWAVIGNHDTGTDPVTREYEFFKSFISPVGNPDELEQGLGEGYWAHRIGNVWMGGGWVRDFYFSTPESDFGEVAFFKKQFETEEFKTAQWKLFFIHEPPYCQGWGTCDHYTGEECLRQALLPLASEAGIQATFHGHMHGYEYGMDQGVYMLLPGGLGGSLDQECPPKDDLPQPWTYNYVHNFAIVEAGCDTLTVRFVTPDGTELDKVEIPYVAPEK